MKRHTIIFAAVLATAAVSAQDLSKNITIERDYTPTLRAATRLENFPQLMQPSIADSRLQFSDMTTATAVPGMIAVLPAASSGPAIAISPYRGYASLGYFPAFNLGASAGYSIIAKPTTRLNAWLQYDGNSYKTTFPEFDDKLTLKRHTFTVGVDFTNVFSGAGRLDVNTFYTLNSYNRPWTGSDKNTSFGQFDFKAVWSARKAQIGYYVGADFGISSFGKVDAVFAVNPLVDKLSETDFGFKGGVAYFLGSSSSLAINASADFSRFSHFNALMPDAGPSEIQPVAGNARTIGVITLAPAYRLRDDNLKVRIGLKSQFNSNSGKTFHLAPDVRLDYNVNETARLYASFTGGQHINTLSSLFNVTPYLSPSLAYLNSSVPVDAEIGVMFGPLKGFSVGLHGGYAVANDWLMPTFDGGTYIFESTDLRAVKGGIDLRWQYRDLLTLTADAEFAPGSYKHASYLNRDRAKAVVNAGVTVNPVKNLTVDAGWHLRSGRSAYLSDGSRYGLGTSSELSIGGRYTFTPQLSVFLEVENLLDSRPELLPGLQAQGIKGLAGVSFKF